MTTILCGLPPASGPKLLAKDFLPQFTLCCEGAFYRGARACYCWEPIFDLVQQPLIPGERIRTRGETCGDCAYHEDSPERREDPYALLGVEVFYCHKGIRRPREWRHPDGRVRPGYPADYQPPQVDGVPYRANGKPAYRCGGWAAVDRAERHARTVLGEMEADQRDDMVALGGRQLAEDVGLL